MNQKILEVITHSIPIIIGIDILIKQYKNIKFIKNKYQNDSKLKKKMNGLFNLTALITILLNILIFKFIQKSFHPTEKAHITNILNNKLNKTADYTFYHDLLSYYYPLILITITMVFVGILLFTSANAEFYIWFKHLKDDTPDYSESYSKVKKSFIILRIQTIFLILTAFITLWTANTNKLSRINAMKLENKTTEKYKINNNHTIEHQKQYQNQFDKFIQENSDYFTEYKNDTIYTINQEPKSKNKDDTKLIVQKENTPGKFIISPDSVEYQPTTVDEAKKYKIYTQLKKEDKYGLFSSLKQLNDSTYQYLDSNNNIITVHVDESGNIKNEK